MAETYSISFGESEDNYLSIISLKRKSVINALWVKVDYPKLETFSLVMFDDFLYKFIFCLKR